jgi:hypothetical protein
MAEPEYEISKRTMKHLFEEAAQFERKIAFLGPDNLRPDSRYQVVEIAADYVVFQLLGDDQMILPWTAIHAIRMDKTTLSIRYG